MELNIQIDESVQTPKFRQIIAAIVMLVKDGTLHPGYKLPPEREFASKLGVSRGTIKKAFEELEKNNIIRSIHGSGTYISMGQDIIDSNRKKIALDKIKHLLEELEMLGFSHREMRAHINIIIKEREKNVRHANIVAVDCSYEALYTFPQQLSYIKHAHLDQLLLDDVRDSANPQSLLAPYDLILTTSTHYSELCILAPTLSDNILQAALSPDRQTIIEIAQISDASKVGVISFSERFARIISNTLSMSTLPSHCELMLYKHNEDAIVDFIKDKDVIILPPLDLDNANSLKLNDLVVANNKDVIFFNYQIERGSLIYIEERISTILQGKQQGGSHL